MRYFLRQDDKFVSKDCENGLRLRFTLAHSIEEFLVAGKVLL